MNLYIKQHIFTWGDKFTVTDELGRDVLSRIMAGASVIGYVIGEGLADSSPNAIEDKPEEEK